MTSLADPPRFRLAGRAGPRVTLESDSGWAVEVFVLEPDIIRMLHRPPGGQRGPRTWSIAPGVEDAPPEGRDRLDAGGFSQPPFTLDKVADTLVIAAERLRLTIRLDGCFCLWEMATASGWERIARDRPTQAYDFGWWAGTPRHYLVREPVERYFGLGEKSGPLDRAGRRFAMRNTDALGYDARRSDPLYKSIPFVIAHNAETGLAYGLFYDTYADAAFDLGCERSHYHGLFRSFAAEAGDLDLYMIAGPAIADVTRRFTWLTGRPALLPRWALGYSGSSMAYADAPDAQARMAEFVDACRRHDILCASVHLSSGYTSIGARRFVFHWNREKFPDPAGFAAAMHAAGLRVIANVKPCLLTGHPLLDEARAEGLLISEPDGEPAWAQFWDGLGAYLDFTKPATAAWWREQATRALLDVGIDATWNDNNEFEITSPSALAAVGPAIDSKPLQTMLMLRASRDAQRARAPGVRPFLVSRSGGAGLQRYAQTWTGDNATSWETLRWNIRMGLGLSLSGVSNLGHDIGGFAGPAPDAELFVRWVEAGVFMPRFSIHSWNADGTVNAPWMHPDATPLVRDLIRLREQLIPYLYDLAWRHHRDGEPIQRPTFFDFPDDPAAFQDCDELMLGPALLVCSVVEPSATERRVRPPAGARWRDFWTGEAHAGGRPVVLPAPLGRPPLLVREDAAIPLNIAAQSFDARADLRAFAIFAGAEQPFEALCCEDDGVSEAWRTGGHGAWRLSIRPAAAAIEVAVTAEGPTPPIGPLALLVRPSEERPLRVRGGQASASYLSGDWVRIDVTVN